MTFNLMTVVAECRHADCRYADCRHVECLNDEWHYALNFAIKPCVSSAVIVILNTMASRGRRSCTQYTGSQKPSLMHNGTGITHHSSKLKIIKKCV